MSLDRLGSHIAHWTEHVGVEVAKRGGDTEDVSTSQEEGRCEG